MQDPTLRTILIILVVLSALALLSLLALGVLIYLGGWWLRGMFDRLMTPDPAALQTRLTAARRRYPGLGDDALVQRLMTHEARKAGLVGAVTGLGGLITLPASIPLDFALSARIQASMIHFIAAVYAPGETAEALKLKTYAIMAGSGVAREAIDASSRVAQAALRKLLTRLLAETAAEALLKIVPVIGALVGFAINYTATRAVGRLALNWYRSQAPLALPAAKSTQTP